MVAFSVWREQEWEVSETRSLVGLTVGTVDSGFADVAPADRRILIVEDDGDVRATVATMLRRAGFEVREAASLAEANAVLELHDVAAALVDLRLGGDDGLILVRELSQRPDTAVLIVTGEADPIDRILGLEIGADDYITKPFHERELLARVKRRVDTVRRLRIAAPDPGALAEGPSTIGGWTIDESRQRVVDADGEPADLSLPEFRTLQYLVESRGTILSRDDIYRRVTGRRERDPLDRYVDNLIANLRRKLAVPGDSGIRTVHRVGYVVD